MGSELQSTKSTKADRAGDANRHTALNGRNGGPMVASQQDAGGWKRCSSREYKGYSSCRADRQGQRYGLGVDGRAGQAHSFRAWPTVVADLE